MDGDNHYDAISAFIESMKHTEPDATLYYLARMLVAGEDIKYIARRICVCASEDVGLANSKALEVATTAMLAVERIGMPEAAKILAHAALYVCCSPKSDTVYGILYAMKDVEKTGNIPIPPFLQDSSYKNAYKLGRGVGLDNIAKYKVEVDPFLKDGEFVIGNPNWYKMNFNEGISVTKDIIGRSRVNDYTGYCVVGGAPVPNSFVYGKKKSGKKKKK